MRHFRKVFEGRKDGHWSRNRGYDSGRENQCKARGIAVPRNVNNERQEPGVPFQRSSSSDVNFGADTSQSYERNANRDLFGYIRGSNLERQDSEIADNGQKNVGNWNCNEYNECSDPTSGQVLATENVDRYSSSDLQDFTSRDSGMNNELTRNWQLSQNDRNQGVRDSTQVQTMDSVTRYKDYLHRKYDQPGFSNDRQVSVTIPVETGFDSHTDQRHYRQFENQGLVGLTSMQTEVGNMRITTNIKSAPDSLRLCPTNDALLRNSSITETHTYRNARQEENCRFERQQRHTVRLYTNPRESEHPADDQWTNARHTRQDNPERFVQLPNTTWRHESQSVNFNRSQQYKCIQNNQQEYYDLKRPLQRNRGSAHDQFTQNEHASSFGSCDNRNVQVLSGRFNKEHLFASSSNNQNLLKTSYPPSRLAPSPLFPGSLPHAPVKPNPAESYILQQTMFPENLLSAPDQEQSDLRVPLFHGSHVSSSTSISSVESFVPILPQQAMLRVLDIQRNTGYLPNAESAFNNTGSSNVMRKPQTKTTGETPVPVDITLIPLPLAPPPPPSLPPPPPSLPPPVPTCTADIVKVQSDNSQHLSNTVEQNISLAVTQTESMTKQSHFQSLELVRPVATIKGGNKQKSTGSENSGTVNTKRHSENEDQNVVIRAKKQENNRMAHVSDNDITRANETSFLKIGEEKTSLELKAIAVSNSNKTSDTPKRLTANTSNFSISERFNPVPPIQAVPPFQFSQRQSCIGSESKSYRNKEVNTVVSDIHSNIEFVNQEPNIGRRVAFSNQEQNLERNQAFSTQKGNICSVPFNNEERNIDLNVALSNLEPSDCKNPAFTIPEPDVSIPEPDVSKNEPFSNWNPNFFPNTEFNAQNLNVGRNVRFRNQEPLRHEVGEYSQTFPKRTAFKDHRMPDRFNRPYEGNYDYYRFNQRPYTPLRYRHFDRSLFQDRREESYDHRRLSGLGIHTYPAHRHWPWDREFGSSRDHFRPWENEKSKWQERILNNRHPEPSFVADSFFSTDLFPERLSSEYIANDKSRGNEDLNNGNKQDKDKEKKDCSEESRSGSKTVRNALPTIEECMSIVLADVQQSADKAVSPEVLVEAESDLAVSAGKEREINAKIDYMKKPRKEELSSSSINKVLERSETARIEQEHTAVTKTRRPTDTKTEDKFAVKRQDRYNCGKSYAEILAIGSNKSSKTDAPVQSNNQLGARNKKKSGKLVVLKAAETMVNDLLAKNQLAMKNKAASKTSNSLLQELSTIAMPVVNTSLSVLSSIALPKVNVLLERLSSTAKPCISLENELLKSAPSFLPSYKIPRKKICSPKIEGQGNGRNSVDRKKVKSVTENLSGSKEVQNRKLRKDTKDDRHKARTITKDESCKRKVQEISTERGSADTEEISSTKKRKISKPEEHKDKLPLGVKSLHPKLRHKMTSETSPKLSVRDVSASTQKEINNEKFDKGSENRKNERRKESDKEEEQNFSIYLKSLHPKMRNKISYSSAINHNEALDHNKPETMHSKVQQPCTLTRGRFVLSTPVTFKVNESRRTRANTKNVGEKITGAVQKEKCIETFDKGLLSAKSDLMYRVLAVNALTRDKSKPLVEKKAGVRQSVVPKKNSLKELKEISDCIGSVVQSRETDNALCSIANNENVTDENNNTAVCVSEGSELKDQAKTSALQLDTPSTQYQPKRTVIGSFATQCVLGPIVSATFYKAPRKSDGVFSCTESFQGTSSSKELSEKSENATHGKENKQFGLERKIVKKDATSDENISFKNEQNDFHGQGRENLNKDRQESRCADKINYEDNQSVLKEPENIGNDGNNPNWSFPVVSNPLEMHQVYLKTKSEIAALDGLDQSEFPIPVMPALLPPIPVSGLMSSTQVTRPVTPYLEKTAKSATDTYEISEEDFEMHRNYQIQRLYELDSDVLPASSYSSPSEMDDSFINGATYEDPLNLNSLDMTNYSTSLNYSSQDTSMSSSCTSPNIDTLQSIDSNQYVAVPLLKEDDPILNLQMHSEENALASIVQEADLNKDAATIKQDFVDFVSGFLRDEELISSIGTSPPDITSDSESSGVLLSDVMSHKRDVDSDKKTSNEKNMESPQLPLLSPKLPEHKQDSVRKEVFVSARTPVRTGSRRIPRFVKRFPNPLPRAKPGKSVHAEQQLYEAAERFLGDFDHTHKRSCRENNSSDVLVNPKTGRLETVKSENRSNQGVLCKPAMKQLQESSSIGKVEKQSGKDVKQKTSSEHLDKEVVEKPKTRQQVARKKLATDEHSDKEVTKEKRIPKLKLKSVQESHSKCSGKQWQVKTREKLIDNKLRSKASVLLNSAKTNSQKILYEQMKSSSAKTTNSPDKTKSNERNAMEITRNNKSNTSKEPQKQSVKEVPVPSNTQILLPKEDANRTKSPKQNKRELPCKLCSVTCDNTFALKLHYNTQHSNWCLKCKTVFKDSESIQNHIATAHSNEISCKICGTSFLYRANYDRHLKSVYHKENEKVANMFKRIREQQSRERTSSEHLTISDDSCDDSVQIVAVETVGQNKTGRRNGKDHSSQQNKKNGKRHSDSSTDRMAVDENEVHSKKRKLENITLKEGKRYTDNRHGYCEVCQRSFKKLSAHLKTNKHLEQSRNRRMKANEDDKQDMAEDTDDAKLVDTDKECVEVTKLASDYGYQIEVCSPGEAGDMTPGSPTQMVEIITEHIKEEVTENESIKVEVMEDESFKCNEFDIVIENIKSESDFYGDDKTDNVDTKDYMSDVVLQVQSPLCSPTLLVKNVATIGDSFEDHLEHGHKLYESIVKERENIDPADGVLSERGNEMFCLKESEVIEENCQLNNFSGNVLAVSMNKQCQNNGEGETYLTIENVDEGSVEKIKTNIEDSRSEVVEEGIAVESDANNNKHNFKLVNEPNFQMDCGTFERCDSFEHNQVLPDVCSEMEVTNSSDFLVTENPMSDTES